MFDIFYSPSGALITLLLLTVLYFFENYDRYLIAVSPIPYIDYSSYEYSILAGPSFTIMYTVGGLLFSLGYSDNIQLFGNSKFSKTGVLALATFTFSLAFGATAFCVNFWQQVIVRVVMGLSQSVITPFSTSVIRDYFPPEVCGSAFGIFNTGTYFAFALSLSLGIWLYEVYGWKMGYICFGIIGMGASLFLPLLSFIQTPKVGGNSSTNNKERHIANGNNSNHSLTESNTDGISLTGDDRRSSSNPTSPTSSATQSPLIPPFQEKDEPVLEEAEDKRSSGRSASLFKRMYATLHEVIFVHWWKHPSIFVLCFATAIRIGGGYIWSSYTGVFFSDLFIKEDGSIDCLFSYSNSTTTGLYNDNACGSDYPYCVNSVCSALTESPWHNQGMDPVDLEEYMSWVPIVGSALGSFLGGMISDYVIKVNVENDSCENSTGNGNGNDLDVDKSAHAATALMINTTIHSKKVNKFVAGRALIAGITCLLSLPLVAYSFYLDSPGCFLIYIASGMIGEVYLSQTLALITDHQFIPTRLITSAVALFMLIITIIGGNSPLLIPLIEEFVGYDAQVIVQFQATAPYTGNPDPITTTFNILNNDANKLQYSMMYALIGCYSLSGLLYILAFWLMVYR